MEISQKEKVILQDLAKEVRDFSEMDKNLKKIVKWKNINELKPGAEPVFMTHLWQISLKEMFPDSSYKCTSEKARYYESFLKRKIFFAKYIDDDNVVEPVVYYNIDAYLEEYPELKVQKRYTEDGGAHEFIPVIINDEDIDKLTDPVLHFNRENTERNRTEALDIFDSILNVIKQPRYFAAKVVDEYSWLRGMENTYMDMAMKPEWMHEALQRITNNYIKRFHLMEDAGIWGTGDKSDPLGSAGLRYISGMNDWRSSEDSSLHTTKLNESWGFTCAEVCNCVSNDMHDDFSFKYDKQVMDLFKYINVGCCETLDKKVELIKALPNARKVSISEWCNVEKGAEAIKGDYVYSYRAAGVPFVQNPWDIEAARKEIQGVVNATNQSKSPLEIVLNIGGTFGDGDPKTKLVEWTEMVKKIINR